MQEATSSGRKTRCLLEYDVTRGELGPGDERQETVTGTETGTGTGTGTGTRTTTGTGTRMGTGIENIGGRRESSGTHQVIVEVGRRRGRRVAPAGNEQSQPQDPKSQREKGIRAQGRKGRGGIGKGAGGAEQAQETTQEI